MVSFLLLALPVVIDYTITEIYKKGVILCQLLKQKT